MEKLYEHGSMVRAIQDVMEKINAINTMNFTEKDFNDLEWTKTVLVAMIEGYYDIFYMNDIDNGYTPVELEKRYEKNIINPRSKRTSRTYKFQFIADAVLKDKDGGLWLVEYKTAAQLGDNYFDRLAFDHQITGCLAYLQEVYGQEFKGVLYRVMKKPGIRQKKATKNKPAETREEFLKRLEDVFNNEVDKYFHERILTRTQDELKHFKDSLWLTTEDIRLTVKNKGFYMNTSNCVIKNCSFLPLCACKPGARDLFKERKSR
jgi:hypothetical protein